VINEEQISLHVFKSDQTAVISHAGANISPALIVNTVSSDITSFPPHLIMVLFMEPNPHSSKHKP
jgi:hypothetical protein